MIPAFKQSKFNVSQIDRQNDSTSEKRPGSSLWFEIRDSFYTRRYLTE